MSEASEHYGSNPRVPYRLNLEPSGLKAPGGKPLIVHIVVAVECWSFDRPMPRKILTPPHDRDNVPDIPNWSWAEYGMRCGLPRLLHALSSRSIRADACVNASVIDVYPEAAEAMLRAGWEFQGHGMTQESLGVEGEAELIEATAAKLRAFTGVQPRGWIGPGLRESYDTPDYLRGAGFDYLCDWVIDDVPCEMTTTHGPLTVVPYTLDLNDSVIYAVEHHSSPEQYNRLRYSVEALGPELALGPKVLTLSFHHHLSGVPHRIGFVTSMLNLLLQRDDTVFMTGGEICDWYQAETSAGKDMRPTVT